MTEVEKSFAEKEQKMAEEMRSRLETFLGLKVSSDCLGTGEGFKLRTEVGEYSLVSGYSITEATLEKKPNGHAPYTSHEVYRLRTGPASLPGVYFVAELIPGTKSRAVAKGIDRIVKEVAESAGLGMPILRS